MVTDEDLTSGNDRDLDDSFVNPRRRNRGKSTKKDGQIGAPSPERRRERPQKIESPTNSIEARRRPNKNRPVLAEGSLDAPRSLAPSEPDPGSTDKNSTRGESDPWTVPQSVRDRFVQDGHRFYFPDGKEAFKDRGRRLTTASENTQVVFSLVEIARSRGWTEVTVSGTERFRQDAWRQARIAGLAVRGYKPPEAEQVQVIRALGRQLPASRSSEGQLVDSQSQEGRAAADAPSAEPRSDRAAPSAPQERIVGRLLEFGRDSYRHDPREDVSYFVRVQTRSGLREIWGKDLERAIKQSLTQPQVGDEVVLQQTGRDVVTVNRAERDATGELKERPVDTHRNRWVLEKESFFTERARAAQLVRDPSVDARAAVRVSPELAGTYLNLRAAELAARRLRDPEDRKRFVAQVRTALAEGIERGEPLQPVRLRERSRDAQRRDRGSRVPESSLARG